MRKKFKIIAVSLIAIVCIGASFGAWFAYFRHPSTLALGQTPAIGLPVYDFSHNDIIGAYGNIVYGNETRFHGGFDFGFNATVGFVAPFSVYVDEIRTWYNDKGGHWQTNVELYINPQWSIEITFESWALNKTYADYQGAAIQVETGQYVAANQTIGNLLYYGSGCHVHFDVKYSGSWICPYDVFTQSAKALFATQFYRVNVTSSWNMP